MLTADRATDALRALNRWLDANQYCGWDPYDALNSPIVRAASSHNRFFGQVAVQLLKRSPVNLRPLLGIAKGFNPKAMGLFLASSIRQHRMADSGAQARVKYFADWLIANTSPNVSGPAWGYNFDWPNRGFFAPAGTPTIVNTSFIGLAFLDLADADVPLRGLDSARALNVARGSCNFVLRDLWCDRRTRDELCFAYTPIDRRLVHNASLLGGQLLAEVGARTREPELIDAALATARFTVRRQRDDGSWAYGEASNDAWVDNFHTGYVLVSLSRISRCTNCHEFDPAIVRGYAYWKERMFLRDGTPKNRPDSVYPIDAHNIAQAVLTFLQFSDRDSEAAALASRVLEWGINQMQDPQGYFHFQISRLYRIRIPYLRWVQAWMQRALTEWIYQQQFMNAMT